MYKVIKKIARSLIGRSRVLEYYDAELRKLIYWIKLERKKYFLQKYGVEALSKIDSAFDTIGIQYWLEFGTLLGVIRDQGFIKNDSDIDIGVFLDDYAHNIEGALKMTGLIKLQKYSADNDLYAVTETYIYKEITIDIFYFRKNRNLMITSEFVPKKGKTWDETIREKGEYCLFNYEFINQGFKRVKLFNIEVFIPENADEHLRRIYGDYEVRNPDWVSGDALNITLVENKYGILVK